MPQFELTAKFQQVHQIHWRGEAASPTSAEHRVNLLLAESANGEPLSDSGLQIKLAYRALQNVKIREAERPARPSKGPAKSARDLPGDRHPLYLIHTAWRSLTPQEQREFLLEMLTPTQRRFLARGFADEDDEEEG